MEPDCSLKASCLVGGACLGSPGSSRCHSLYPHAKQILILAQNKQQQKQMHSKSNILGEDWLALTQGVGSAEVWLDVMRKIFLSLSLSLPPFLPLQTKLPDSAVRTRHRQMEHLLSGGLDSAGLDSRLLCLHIHIDKADQIISITTDYAPSHHAGPYFNLQKKHRRLQSRRNVVILARLNRPFFNI